MLNVRKNICEYLAYAHAFKTSRKIKTKLLMFMLSYPNVNCSAAFGENVSWYSKHESSVGIACHRCIQTSLDRYYHILRLVEWHFVWFHYCSLYNNTRTQIILLSNRAKKINTIKMKTMALAFQCNK